MRNGGFLLIWVDGSWCFFWFVSVVVVCCGSSRRSVLEKGDTHDKKHVLKKCLLPKLLLSRASKHLQHLFKNKVESKKKSNTLVG